MGVLHDHRDDTVAVVGPLGDYGYDAPYALVVFASLGAASVIGAIASGWNPMASTSMVLACKPTT